jgi:ABC-2 type transport system permease protein
MGNLSLLWLVVRKDLLRKIRSPLSTLALLAFPVIFSLLIGVTFGSRGEKIASIRIALVDEDKGLLSKLLQGSFGQSKMEPKIEVVTADSIADGLALVEKNKVSACLRIPAGFTDSLLQARSTYLEVVQNPAESTYPFIVEQYVRVLGQLGSSAVRVLGSPLGEFRQMTKGKEAPADLAISDLSVSISHRMKAVTRYVFPPAIRLETVKPTPEAKKEDQGSPIQVALFVLPGLAAYALLMLGIVHMADFQRERAHGTMARQLVSPLRATQVIWGKVGATWILSLLSILILTVIATVWARVSVSVLAFVLLSLSLGLAATGFAAFIQSLATSDRGGSVIGSIVVMIMSMLGGSFIPLNVLPRFVQRIAPFTLTYWAGTGYQRLLFEQAGLGELGKNIGVLFGMGVLFAVVAALRFRRRFQVGG